MIQNPKSIQIFLVCRKSHQRVTVIMQSHRRQEKAAVVVLVMFHQVINAPRQTWAVIVVIETVHQQRHQNPVKCQSGLKLVSKHLDNCDCINTCSLG